MNLVSYQARTFTLFIAGGVATALFGCHSKPQNQPPNAQEQKHVEQKYQKAIEQQKQLTSGYDHSMQYVTPSTGYIPKKKPAKQQPPSQTQAQQPLPQSQPEH
jgi:hypothetical protein